MRQVTARIFGIPLWGLGNILYAPNGKGDFIVGHDGDNYPAINTTARIDPTSGDGIIVLSSGNVTLASKIGGDWTFWHSGVVDLMSINSKIPSILILFVSGTALIILGAVVALLRRRAHRDFP